MRRRASGAHSGGRRWHRRHGRSEGWWRGGLLLRRCDERRRRSWHQRRGRKPFRWGRRQGPRAAECLWRAESRSRGHTFIKKPLRRGLAIRADEENFLDGAGARVEAFEAGVGGVLDLEAGRRLDAAYFDSSGDDTGDVRAVLDNAVEDRVQPPDAAVLALDAAEFHRSIIVAG